MTATQASALSCIQPSVQRAFADAQAAEASYLPVLGRFVDVDIKQTGGQDRTPRDRSGTARFVGRPVARNGFGEGMDVNVSVTLRCLAHWCGSIREGEKVLTFLQVAGSDFFFEAGPCAGAAFYAPVASDITVMRQCLRGKRCESSN